MSSQTVAVIGAGVAGVSAARYLSSEGFAPTVFEAHSDLGGQWNLSNPNSGVWPTMRTNTAGFATKLSDVQYREGVNIFPRNGEVLTMIRDMIAANGIGDLFRFGAEVTGVACDGDGYAVAWRDAQGSHRQVFDKSRRRHRPVRKARNA